MLDAAHTKATDDGDHFNMFEQIYLCCKAHGNIALEFKDFNEAAKVFKRLKNFCGLNKRYL